jgi:hypothetical protein
MSPLASALSKAMPALAAGMALVAGVVTYSLETSGKRKLRNGIMHEHN